MDIIKELNKRISYKYDTYTFFDKNVIEYAFEQIGNRQPVIEVNTTDDGTYVYYNIIDHSDFKKYKPITINSIDNHVDRVLADKVNDDNMLDMIDAINFALSAFYHKRA